MAIACQGGGSHTAFTAGVLKRLLRERHEIVALSGTSGGAICALLAWCGLLAEDRGQAIRSLEEFWWENSASSLPDAIANDWLIAQSRWWGQFGEPQLSPYLYPAWARDHLRRILEKCIDFASVRTLFEELPAPLLLVSAVDVRSGEFKVFRNGRDPDSGERVFEVSADAILASAAIPTLFRAVHIDGGVYWDGLFSQNPPVRELPDADPDEIWIVQINPDRRETEPTQIAEIRDRRNELAGNLSLRQEVRFIEKINDLVDWGVLTDKVTPAGHHGAGSGYHRIEVRWIRIDTDVTAELDSVSKLDRSTSLIERLIQHGEDQAESFLATLPPPRDPTTPPESKS